MAHPHRSLWHMIAAPVVWAVHFVGVYGWTAVVCARLGEPGLARTGTLLMSLVALGLISVLGWRAWRQWGYERYGDHIHDRPTVQDRREFLGHSGLLLALVSGIAVIFVTMPVLFIGSCR